MDGAKLVERGKCDEAEKMILDAFQTGIRKADIGIDYLEDLELRAEPIIPVLRTEIEPLDEKLIGGFGRQELVVWLASTSVGKSCHNTLC